MYNTTQAIETPFGVSVFGSALLRVTPDVASLNLAVFCVEEQPRGAFAASREATAAVRQFLSAANVTRVGSSRVTLSQEFQRTGGERQFVGYGARVAVHIVLTDLDSVEEILVGAIDAGANEVESVTFESSELKAHRALARQHAVEAAREKAKVYCAAAGVDLGRVLHIEDINPDVLTGNNEGHFRSRLEPDHSGDLGAFDPGAITVAGAVRIGFEIVPGPADA